MLNDQRVYLNFLAMSLRKLQRNTASGLARKAMYGIAQSPRAVISDILKILVQYWNDKE
jgi:hypothetical protein